MLKTVLLIMRRASLAQGLMAKVQDAPGLQLCYEPDYACGRLRPTAGSCSCVPRGRRRRSTGLLRPSGGERLMISYSMMCLWIIWLPACSPSEVCRK